MVLKTNTGKKTSKKDHQLTVDTPLQYVKGVGPQLSSVFNNRDIYTVKDLLYFLPRTYQDNRRVETLKEIQVGKPSIFVADVVKKSIIPLKSKRRKMYIIVVSDGFSQVSCKFFRIPYKDWFNSLRVGERVEVRGVASLYRSQLEFNHPQIFHAKKEQEAEPESKEDVLLPVYTEIESVSQYKIRNIIKTIFDGLEDSHKSLEWLPEWLRKKYELLSLFESLKGLHFPNKELVDDYLNFKTEFQKRIIFDEFFESQFYFLLKKQDWEKQKAQEIPIDEKLLSELKSKLPFELTGSQETVLKEIINDLKSNHPMHRLLQGDVGSGKTIVAFLAAAACAKAGYQSALMVPTEILADQHYKNAVKFLEPFGVKVEKLTGKMKAKEKRTVSAVLNSGFCDFCIGTHALIQEGVQFKNLGFVIIDEQHRFGAHQRALLKKKGGQAHFLVMTATPIPRTLSLTVYGDLEISSIKELPKNRKAIVTRRVFHNKRLEVFNFLRDQVLKGEQAYVVYPLIEESETLDLKNAINQYEKLKEHYKELKWGLLTGKMNSEEKQEVMQKFINKEIDVLVSTTVIEVGVDVPNATVMVVEHAERFGLSQMHQLRGRVGRGSQKSYCIFVLGTQFSQEAKERAYIMETTSDGFKIAEKDLEIRGPGEFLGSRQSGLPTFKTANIIRDTDILSIAKKASKDLLAKDASLKAPEHSQTKIKFEHISNIFKPG